MTNSSPIVALAPVVGLAMNCAVHVMVARIMRARSPYPALAAGAGAGVLVTGFLTLAGCIWSPAGSVDTAAFLAMNLIASLALGFCYSNFVNLSVASLRIRILAEIAEAGGSMNRSALLEQYGSGSVADVRLSRLVSGGHLVESDGRLRTGRLHFLLVSRMFDILRVLIFGRGKAAVVGSPPPTEASGV